MKALIAKILRDALAGMPELAGAARELSIDGSIERTRDPSHGDFASNVAMRLAKPAHRPPRELAEKIVARIGNSEDIEGIDVAGPGFINFRLSPAVLHREIAAILDRGTEYGRESPRTAPRILLEFVSANPTGPLHVGHGRHAAFGATLGNLLEAAGYPVFREYYVNDAGRQMDILGVSVWLRWLETQGTQVEFPEAGYRGAYIRDIAKAIDTTGVPVPDPSSITAAVEIRGQPL